MAVDTDTAWRLHQMEAARRMRGDPAQMKIKVFHPVTILDYLGGILAAENATVVVFDVFRSHGSLINLMFFWLGCWTT